MNQYLIYVIPLFLFFIVFEMVANAITHKESYKFEDTITNISLGLGQQIIEALIKTFFAFLFFGVYKHSIFKIPNTIWTFLIVVLIHDFIYYWFHRLSHTMNILWAVHIVHHQSREFNLTVSLRQPWLHKIAGFAFYLIFPFIGISPTIMVLAFAFQTFYQFWLHTRFIGKLGILEHLLVTPSHHRVHHGANDIYIDKNYGNTLIVWDKLFVTFQVENEPVVFGTVEPFTNTDPIFANIHFWKKIIKKNESRKGFVNKTRTFFQRPVDISETNCEGGKKEHIPNALPAWIKWYIVLQYVLILSATFYFLLKQDSFSFVWKSISVVFIIWSICTFSTLMERKKNAVFWEFIRVILLCFLFMHLLQ